MFDYSSLRNIIQTKRELWFNTSELDIKNDPDDKWVEGIGIRTVLNSNGAIKIGNIIYVVKPLGETFEITDGSFETMTLIINGQTSGLHKTIIHKADGSEIDGNNGSVLKVAAECKGWRSNSKEEPYKSGTRKLKRKVWVHNFPFYASVGSESENFRKKNNGSWTTSNASSIGTTSGGVLYSNLCNYFDKLSLGETRSNKKTARDARTYLNQVTKSKTGEYHSTHTATDGGDSKSFALSL